MTVLFHSRVDYNLFTQFLTGGLWTIFDFFKLTDGAVLNILVQTSLCSCVNISLEFWG